MSVFCRDERFRSKKKQGGSGLVVSGPGSAFATRIVRVVVPVCVLLAERRAIVYLFFVVVSKRGVDHVFIRVLC